MTQYPQTSIQQSLADLAKADIGNSYDPTKYYILTGCKNTGIGQNYIISEGAIFGNEEIYQVDAATFTAGVGQTAVGKITITIFKAYNEDNATREWAVTKPDHIVKKILFKQGDPNSGDINFSDLIPINQSSGALGPAGGDLSGTYPNPNVVKIQNVDVSSVTPEADQVFSYDGTLASWKTSDYLIRQNGQIESNQSITVSYTIGDDNEITYGRILMGNLDYNKKFSIPPISFTVTEVNSNNIVSPPFVGGGHEYGAFVVGICSGLPVATPYSNGYITVSL